MLLLIFISSSLIGKFLSKKYIYRLRELDDLKNALNIFKTKIQFTYEPIPDIFEEIEKNTTSNVGKIFGNAKLKMINKSAQESWNESIVESENNLKPEDKDVLKMLGKLLGQTDKEGQISQIDVTQNFLDTQLKNAEIEKEKNEKLYKQLGTTIGLVIVIILI